jgi:hypothetical protein
MDTVINHRQILTYIAAIVDVRYGSIAALERNITRTAAAGTNPALH